jgi:hypothetical protein
MESNGTLNIAAIESSLRGAKMIEVSNREDG